MPQYRLASHTISSHHAKKFVTFLQSETTLTSVSGQDGLKITTHRCMLISAEPATRLIGHLSIKKRLYLAKRYLVIFVAGLGVFLRSTV